MFFFNFSVLSGLKWFFDYEYCIFIDTLDGNLINIYIYISFFFVHFVFFDQNDVLDYYESEVNNP